jgi:hypothetical protein
MEYSLLRSLVAVIGIASLAPAPIAGQTPAAPGKAKTAGANSEAARNPTPPRTPWGEPDLQGTWTFKTITPLERPAEFAGKEFLTESEAAELEKRAAVANSDEERPADAARDVAAAYNDFWWDRGDKVVKSRRSSLIIDPPDGRVPPLTPEARKRVDGRGVARDRPAHGPEDRSQFERCVSRGLPRLPGGYNQHLQILQTPGFVVILYEMMREARIVPLDGRPHVGTNVRQWMGDSRGRWEGNTLIVETTNFNRQHEFRGATEDLRLIERFQRVDADTIDYQFTAADPATWTRSWTAAVPLTRTDARMYEYACHEGNYGMSNLLRSARAVDDAEGPSDGRK